MGGQGNEESNMLNLSEQDKKVSSAEHCQTEIDVECVANVILFLVSVLLLKFLLKISHTFLMAKYFFTPKR